MSKEPISWFTKSLSIYYLALILGAINIGSLGSVLKILGLIPIVLWILQYRGKLVLSPLFLSASVFLVWTAISLLWSIDRASTQTRAMTQLSFVLLLAATNTYNYNSREINILRTSLVWSSRITVLISLLFSSLLHGRLWLSGVINEDPNYLCMYFLFGMANCVEAILNNYKKTLLKSIYIVELFAYLYVIIATGSRGGAIAAGTTVAIIYYRIQKDKKSGPKKIIGSIVFAIVVVGGLILATNLVADSILRRYLVQDVIDTGGTGRTQLWSDSIHTYIKSSLLRQLIGYGTGTARTIASVYNFRRINVIHNIFLENLLEVGLIGAILYTIYIFKFWNYARKADRFCFAILSGLMVMSLTVSAAAVKAYWNILIFTICVYKHKIHAAEAVVCDEKSPGYSSQ